MSSAYHDVADPQVATQLLGAVLRIADTINEKSLSSEKRMGKILTVVLGYLDAEQGSIMVLDRRKLVVRAASRKHIIGMTQPLDSPSVAAWVAREGEALFIPDISKDDRFPTRASSSYKKNSLLSAPILHQGKVMGVLNVTDKAGKHDLFKEEVKLLLHFSSIILWSLVLEDLQGKLKKQRATLRKRNTELHRQEELRNQLTAMLAHDLKNPLAEVIANLDILSYSVQGEEKEFIEGAQTSCDQAVRMVSNLVSVDKIADDKLQLLREDLQPSALLHEAVAGLRAMAQLKNIELQLSCEEDLPVLQLDRTLIIRVIQNLLANAISYSEQETRVSLACRRQDEDNLLLAVADQGPGIPEGMNEVVFDKYARLSSMQADVVGNGLGLHFCKLAIKLHGGKIWVENLPEKGSCFYISLPLNNK